MKILCSSVRYLVGNVRMNVVAIVDVAQVRAMAFFSLRAAH